MLFGNKEKRKHRPMLALTVGALAAIGACNIVRGGKRIVKGAAEKMMGMFKKEKTEDGCEE